MPDQINGIGFAEHTISVNIYIIQSTADGADTTYKIMAQRIHIIICVGMTTVTAVGYITLIRTGWRNFCIRIAVDMRQRWKYYILAFFTNSASKDLFTRQIIRRCNENRSLIPKVTRCGNLILLFKDALTYLALDTI